MNSKGFKDVNKAFKQGMGTNPRALIPLVLGGLGLWALSSSIYYGISINILVDVGHYAIKFNKFTGLSPQRYSEGYNLKFPLIEEPIIYNVQTR